MSDHDESGFDIRAAFEVAVGLGDQLSQSVEQQKRLIRRLDAVTPIMHRPATSAVCPTPTAAFAMDLGTPSQGTFWEVRKVVIGGIEVTTTAAGSAGLYLSGSPTVNGAGLNNCEDYAASLPNVGYYGTGALYVRANEHLFAVIFGGTAGQIYVANAFCRIYQDAKPEDWIS